MEYKEDNKKTSNKGKVKKNKKTVAFITLRM